MHIKVDNPKGIIYLQHPALASVAVYIEKGRNESLAFMIADAGYDLWMGHFRGYEHSRKHKYLTISDREYWNYS